MRYMLLRNIYIRSSCSLHYSPDAAFSYLVPRFTPQPAYQNSDGNPSRNTNSTHQINWDHGPTSYLRVRTHPSAPSGISIPHTGFNWDHGPTSCLRGRNHPSTPPGKSIPHAGLNWDHGPTLFSCFYHYTDFEMLQ